MWQNRRLISQLAQIREVEDEMDEVKKILRNSHKLSQHHVKLSLQVDPDYANSPNLLSLERWKRLVVTAEPLSA